MKKIPENFKPTEQSLNNLQRHGVLPDFVEYELPNFITYWEETGGKKKSWQMTLQVWMKRAHQGKAGREWEENRHIRERHSKPNTDFFSIPLDLSQPTKSHRWIDEGEDSSADPKYTIKGEYKIQHTPIPGEGETMTFEEFSKQVRK